MSSADSGTEVAVVTGGNRGIGLEVCRKLAERGYTVVLGSRDATKGEEAAKQLGGNVSTHQLDVTDEASVAKAAEWVEAKYGRVDVLVNNAGILRDAESGMPHASFESSELDDVSDSLDTNLMGAWRMTAAFLPLLRKSERPRIVNVSSQSGSLASMRPGQPTYSISKAALNALTRILSAELHSEGILVNAVCPAWTATDMGGEGGRPIEEGAASVIWAATLAAEGPSGGFFRDGRSLAW